MKNIQSEQQKESRIKINKDSLRDPWDNINCSNICIVGFPEDKKERKGLKTYLKKTNKYDLTYMFNLINKIDGQNRNRGMYTWSRMTADREKKGRVGRGETG